jgi:hypothetical protein
MRDPLAAEAWREETLDDVCFVFEDLRAHRVTRFTRYSGPWMFLQTPCGYASQTYDNITGLAKSFALRPGIVTCVECLAMEVHDVQD